MIFTNDMIVASKNTYGEQDLHDLYTESVEYWEELSAGSNSGLQTCTSSLIGCTSRMRNYLGDSRVVNTST